MKRSLLLILAVLLCLSVPASAQRGTSPFRVVVLTAVTAGTSVPVNVSAYNTPVVYLSSTGTTSGGVVTIEEADYDPSAGQIYTGTWAPITTVNASTFTGGAQAAYHCAVGSYRFLRVRVSSAITGGGTITASVAGS